MPLLLQAWMLAQSIPGTKKKARAFECRREEGPWGNLDHDQLPILAGVRTVVVRDGRDETGINLAQEEY